MIKNKFISLDCSVIQTPGNIVSDMGGEKVMLSVKNGKYYNLGGIGGAIWDLIGEKIEVGELISNLTSEYNVEQSECENQVMEYLELLFNEGLIEINNK